MPKHTKVEKKAKKRVVTGSKASKNQFGAVTKKKK